MCAGPGVREDILYTLNTICTVWTGEGVGKASERNYCTGAALHNLPFRKVFPFRPKNPRKN
jgi:hypothetical protein